MSDFYIASANSLSEASRYCFNLSESNLLAYAKIELSDGTVIVCGRGKEKNFYKKNNNQFNNPVYDNQDFLVLESLNKFMAIWNNGERENLSVSDLVKADGLMILHFKISSLENILRSLDVPARRGNRYKEYWQPFLSFADESARVNILEEYVTSFNGAARQEDWPSDDERLDAIYQIRTICKQKKDFCRNLSLTLKSEIKRLNYSLFDETGLDSND